MMKRIFSLLLLVSMLCLALASCGETDLDKSKEYLEKNPLVDSNPKETLTFCLVTDTAIDNAALLAMQASFNKLLEVSDRTHLQFVNWTTAEYAAKLNEKLAAVKAARESATAGGTATPSKKNEYPRVLDTQFDIILVTSYEMLTSLIQSEQIADLTDLMDKKYYGLLKNDGVTASFLTSAKVDGKTYGVPNCNVLGEYTYLLVDKAYAEHYGYLISTDFTDWESTAALRAAIEAAPAEGAYHYDFAEDPYDVDAPVRLVKGSYADRTVYGSGCYLYVEEKPIVNKSELFKSMLAVSSYSVDVSRAMEIIYEINTDKALRTILEYGVENTTYELNNGIVTLKDNSAYAYAVNPLYTGNVFALYPTAATKDLVAGWRIHNAEITFVDDITPPAAQ